ncbi:interleukin-6-like [Osmerus eperlanus]|uniref:interleukin-6-like n=1 Tax=Osmerus eperlanus TaxID=29151 RepID=UPI002E166828
MFSLTKTSHFALMITWLLLNATGSPVPTPVSEVPLEETSGDELNVPTSCTFSASTNWESKIKVLVHEVTELQGQRIKEHKFNASITDSLKYYTLSTPKAGCLNNHQSKETCQKLSEGLTEYMVLLQHAETESNSSEIVHSIINHTKDLLHLLQHKRKDSKVVALNMKDQDKLLKELSAGTEWQKKITELVILRDLRAFLADTKRTLCKLERRNKKMTSLEQM